MRNNFFVFFLLLKFGALAILFILHCFKVVYYFVPNLGSSLMGFMTTVLPLLHQCYYFGK